MLLELLAVALDGLRGSGLAEHGAGGEELLHEDAGVDARDAGQPGKDLAVGVRRGG
jgi:hypothetical protein